jgi:hypothetical protein
VAIRFGIAGLILLPYLLKKGLAVARLGVGRTGSDYAGWWGTDGVGFLRWSAIRARGTRSVSVYCPPYRLRSWRRSCLARPSPLLSGSGSS